MVNYFIIYVNQIQGSLKSLDRNCAYVEVFIFSSPIRDITTRTQGSEMKGPR